MLKKCLRHLELSLQVCSTPFDEIDNKRVFKLDQLIDFRFSDGDAVKSMRNQRYFGIKLFDGEIGSSNFLGKRSK